MFIESKQITFYELDNVSNSNIYEFIRNEGSVGVKREYLKRFDAKQLKKYICL